MLGWDSFKRPTFSAAALAAAMLLGASAAQASPWAEVGDTQLRSDIQVLAAAGGVDDITTQWPLPWAGLVESLERQGALDGEPAFVRAAAKRVLTAAHEQIPAHEIHASATIDVASKPSVVYGYDGMGREKAQGAISGEVLLGDTTAIRISAGGELSDWNNGHGRFVPDGSYIAQKIGGAVLYAGYLSQWWGPGWISALSLSNNAHPVPQIGIERLSTAPFQSPWLSWLGPWQMQFLVGVLDGPRVDQNTLYNGLRVTFSPLPGLQIGLARTEEFCGSHHPCNPISYYFEFTNQKGHANHTNDEGVFDLHYTSMAWGTPFELYGQVMNEDSNPIVHSDSSYLAGGSVWLPIGGSAVRLTAEYADTVPTDNIFSFGKLAYGSAYTNYSYVDGMRYRGRTLGFSLDGDSRLETLQASWIDGHDWTYTLTYDHAAISTRQFAYTNIVTTAPVTINLGEARIKMPLSWATIEIAGRLQDDQPRPDHGFEGSVEAALTFAL